MRTSEKKVMGMMGDGYSIKPMMLTVRITADERGKSLSLSDDKSVILMIPLEAIEKRLKEVL